MSSLVNISEQEERIAGRVDSGTTRELSVSQGSGGLAFVNMNEAMEFAKLMSLSQVAVPKHLRSNPGACLAVVVQAIEWRMSPYAVANKSYSVNDRLAYEAQLIQAVILQRAPIKGRFRYHYSGEGPKRKLRIEATTTDGDVVDYDTPEIGKISVQNSPLWKADPDQQLGYYGGRALCRRHFPDVLLGVYAKDEIEAARGPESARDVTPKPAGITGIQQRLLDRQATATIDMNQHVERELAPVNHDPETGEISEVRDGNSPVVADGPAAARSPGDKTAAGSTLTWREQGRAAYHADMDRTDCPADATKEQKAEWLAGYEEAMTETEGDDFPGDKK